MSGRNLLTRALHMVGAGRITAVDDTGVIQKLQVTERPGPDGGPTVSDKIENVGTFGLTSNPPLQSEVVLLRLWGNRTLTLGVGTNHQPSRIKNLQPGETVIYNVGGSKVYLSNEAVIIDGAGLPLKIQNVGEQVTMDATLSCTGDVIANSASQAVSLATHVHGITGGPETTAPLP